MAFCCNLSRWLHPQYQPAVPLEHLVTLEEPVEGGAECQLFRQRRGAVGVAEAGRRPWLVLPTQRSTSKRRQL